MTDAPVLRLLGGLVAGSVLAVVPSLLVILVFAADGDGPHWPSRTASTGLGIVMAISAGVSLIIGLPLILRRFQRAPITWQWLLLTGASAGLAVVLIPALLRIAYGDINLRDVPEFAFVVLLGAVSGALAGTVTWWIGVRGGELDARQDGTG